MRISCNNFINRKTTLELAENSSVPAIYCFYLQLLQQYIVGKGYFPTIPRAVDSITILDKNCKISYAAFFFANENYTLSC